MARWIVNSGPVARRIDQWIESLDAKKKKDDDRRDGEEEEELTIPQRRQRLLRMAFEAFVQGPRGFVHETQLLVSPSWGFNFEDVTYDNVQVWHGAKDTFAPAVMIRWMVERLPHVQYKEYETDNHVSLGDHFEEVFGELVPEEVLEKHRAGVRERDAFAQSSS
ncbi:unnamed protein product [Peniophora sp. CBMAI 1063]|nr:unnamed protein product [Peniophora sp. CBMAI 1063]